MDRETLVQTGLASAAVRDRTPPRSFVARVASGASSGVQLALGARTVVVGADPSCDLVLDDSRVSRRHVELQAVVEGVRVKDLGSRNGTVADGAKVREATFPAGVRVKVGSTTLHITSSPPPPVKPSSRLRFGALVGESVAMRELFAVLELASPTDATVLLEGESGTGKELCARAIHDHSARAGRSFVVLDCSAVSEQLLESHLFGHIKGAFTGADAAREGAFLTARGGTLFIDEIGEMPLAAQSRLLRALEARTVQPLGSDKPIAVDVRIVAATHQDLAAQVEDKTFRFDLFHRLSVVHLAMPPLRDRLEDLPCLVAALYEGRGVESGPIEGPNLTTLERHPFKGNVRELRNVLERAFVLAGSEGARFAELKLWLPLGAPGGDTVDTSLPFKEAKQRWVSAFERRYLAALYERFKGNITRASEHAEINRRHFRELLEHHGLYHE